MKKTCCLFLFMITAVLSPVLNAQNETVAKDWTREDCLQHGMKANPQIRIAESSIDSEKARLMQVDASFDPKIDLRSSWKRQKTEAAHGRAIVDALTDSTSESVSVGKTLYDSGQTLMQKKSAQESLAAAREKSSATRIELAANIKTMFFRAQQARALLQVRLETLEGYQRHLEKVQGYVEVGTKPPFDITRAQVDVANAKVDLISARSQLKVALANLARSIGLDESISIAEYPYVELQNADYSQKDVLLAEALQRPELKAAEYQKESARFKVKEAQKNMQPSLSASADYSWSGSTTPLDRQWGVGITMSWPVFDGSLQRARVDSAQSQLQSSAASFDNLRLGVSAELENSLTGLADAIERYQATAIVVQQASESLHLAEGRYDAGFGSPIEIADARVEMARARGNHVVAYFDSLIARAEFDRVLGRYPVELSVKPLTNEKDQEKRP
jgi:outer membrane protein TolC